MDSIYPSPHEPKPLGSLPEGHGLYAADNSRLPTGRTYDASKEATAAVRPSRGGNYSSMFFNHRRGARSRDLDRHAYQSQGFFAVRFRLLRLNRPHERQNQCSPNNPAAHKGAQREPNRFVGDAVVRETLNKAKVPVK